jgi:diguanylate cyclase (GGDEF)-like protein/PAS domain S-box-containing protein
MSNEHEVNVENLQAEIIRLNKIIQSLMNRAEHNTSFLGSNFNLFQTAITLEDKVRSRTEELENARQKMEKLTRTLREKEYQTRLLVENSPVSIHEIDLDGKVTFMNRAGLRMRGLNDEDEVKGTMYIDAVSAEDKQRVSWLLSLAYAGETSHFEFEGSGPNKKMYASSFIPILNKNGRLEKLMGITEDVTERKNAEEQLRNFAFYDPLTHLPNRRLFNDRLEQAMSAGKRSGHYSALLFLDLDNFKMLNDTMGHDTGDLLLIEVARRISNCLREMDTLARLGGDEFVVLISNLDVDKKAAYDKAYIVAEKIRSVLAEPYLLVCKQSDSAETVVEHNSTASIGVVLFITNNAGKEEIIKLADAAMYDAKAGGRNQVCFYKMNKENKGKN